MKVGGGGGQLLGAAFGGVAAKAWGDAAAMLVVAVFCALTLALLAWRRASTAVEGVHRPLAPRTAEV
jgi:predicted MFS family arabinose efflux permease